MKSSNEYNEKHIEQGRAIARGMNQENVQQQKNMAKAGKRHQTMLENAAEKALGGQGVKFNAPGDY